MNKLLDSDFEILDKCPWDNSPAETAKFLYQDDMGCDVVRCPECGIVYAKRRLNGNGLPKYWGDYLSRVHMHDPEAVKKRIKMYEIDYEFFHLYVPMGRVLDVGCGNGSFLDVYKKQGYETFGVEYGKEAATTAEKRHRVRYGVFDEMDFGEEKFDLIIFRGVLQYIPNPKLYLEKAVHLLKSDGGHLFITAQPNMDALAFRLFGKFFTEPVTGADFIGFTEPALTAYLDKIRLRKIGERYFYIETPYADENADLLKMAKAIQYRNEGKNIDFSAPSYWGNMMTLMYKKI
ncbi:class I SAM-dependent methyltransferase [Selenomonas noxia]|uniref:class I SAM-dependent methyltransferase n=1 Tax=Selenomonas noxia TaxID=135083 RepID=UPI003C761648